jgi:thiol-disulfide isomerase/thioredoxin
VIRALVILALAGCPPPATNSPQPPRDARLVAIEHSVALDGAPVGTSPQATVLFLFASWCGNCHHELAVLEQLRPQHPAVRVLGVNYRAHEEYRGYGNAEAVRAYVARAAPWLQVVPIDEPLFTQLGRPPKIPTLFVFDRGGVLVEVYDRRERAMPDARELAALFARL